MNWLTLLTLLNIGVYTPGDDDTILPRDHGTIEMPISQNATACTDPANANRLLGIWADHGPTVFDAAAEREPNCFKIGRSEPSDALRMFNINADFPGPAKTVSVAWKFRAAVFPAQCTLFCNELSPDGSGLVYVILFVSDVIRENPKI